MKARMTKLPTTPPTMRIVFVFVPLEEEGWEVAEGVEEVVEVGVTGVDGVIALMVGKF